MHLNPEINNLPFDLPKNQSNVIKVIGVGGGGSNAVNHMYRLGIKGVDFVVCNTDHQALDTSPVPTKIPLGQSLTEGRGAGSIPDVGKNAAIENLEDVNEILAKNTKMIFVTAGMGGGTGTGASPVIANIAHELGALTVGVVTRPFGFEGRRRSVQAEEGIQALRDVVDTLIVIPNDRLLQISDKDIKVSEAYIKSDEILANGVKGTILASKGTSKDGNTKFIRLFKQVGVLFKGDEGKFTGDITDVEIGGKKALVGWLNDKSDKPNISGYANEPGVKTPNKEEKLSF